MKRSSGKKFLTVFLAMMMVLTCVSPVFAEDDIQVRFSGQMAGTSGKMAYYAVGIDGGGPLYSYNTSTCAKKKVAKGKWSWLNIKGSYLYLAKNTYGGSDGRCYYIYKMKKNGTSKKKLVNGHHPVLKGNYIYYISVKKTTRDGIKMDGPCLGIYRIDLNGKGKKCILKAGTNEYFGALGVTSKGLLFVKNGSWYSCSFTGSNLKAADIDDYNSNLTIVDTYSGYSSDVDVARSGYEYFGKGKTVYKEKDDDETDDDEKAVATTVGTVKKIVLSGKQMLVVSRSTKGYYTYYNVYMMKRNGKSKKRVIRGVEVSGGWDYV